MNATRELTTSLRIVGSLTFYGRGYLATAEEAGRKLSVTFRTKGGDLRTRKVVADTYSFRPNSTGLDAITREETAFRTFGEFVEAIMSGNDGEGYVPTMDGTTAWGLLLGHAANRELARRGSWVRVHFIGAPNGERFTVREEGGSTWAVVANDGRRLGRVVQDGGRYVAEHYSSHTFRSLMSAARLVAFFRE